MRAVVLVIVLAALLGATGSLWPSGGAFGLAAQDEPTADAQPARPRPLAEVATASRAHEVTLYTAPWCGWCRKTLAFLDERGVDYVNKDIEADPRYADELREKTGRIAIPYVEIDGHPIRGFDPGEMTRRLQ